MNRVDEVATDICGVGLSLNDVLSWRPVILNVLNFSMDKIDNVENLFHETSTVLLINAKVAVGYTYRRWELPMYICFPWLYSDIFVVHLML